MEPAESRSLRALFAEDARRWLENWRTGRDRSGRWSWVNLDWIGSVIGPASL
ncbi:hypothetical protein [Nocardia sp. NPDC051570]|uniref:hypothetical protein n=1 Tax=Nocardia sp. NPDC051570 TaxID=3364324 RepID=UPI00378D6A3B